MARCPRAAPILCLGVLAGLGFAGQGPQGAPVGGGCAGRSLQDLLDAHYPAQYVAQKLEDGERINVDGSLDEAAWSSVPWLDNFLDLAGPRFAGQGPSTWQEASREYAESFTGERNPTKVKVRWDDNFLYVGSVLHSRHVAASVTGHCDELQSSVWGTPVLPYFDDDFEVFVDASQDNYFYVEYEVNARNASYSTLWSLPQAGLGSVAPECGGGNAARRTCCNTTWNNGKGLCDKGVESEARGWTMEMFDASKRPGDGMLSATRNNTDSWSLEIRFPILSTDDHGGLINLFDGSHYPDKSPRDLDPNSGQRFWWATFANALHAPWWSRLNQTDVGDPQIIKGLCQEVLSADQRRNGFSQFLVDANNAAPTCYYEAASQHLGGHQYMHNPDNFGYLQFAAGPEAQCKNVLWPARFVLAQVYQAQVQWLSNPSLGNGSYATSVAQLTAPSACTIANACNATALAQALQHLNLEISAKEGEKVGSCARYPIGDWQTSNWTGGPCFRATVAYTVRSRADPSRSRPVVGTIDEARYMSFPTSVGQRWNDADASWLCLDEVEVLAPQTLGIHV